MLINVYCWQRFCYRNRVEPGAPNPRPDDQVFDSRSGDWGRMIDHVYNEDMTEMLRVPGGEYPTRTAETIRAMAAQIEQL